MYVCMHVCMSVCLYVCLCVCVCACVCVCGASAYRGKGKSDERTSSSLDAATGCGGQRLVLGSTDAGLDRVETCLWCLVFLGSFGRPLL